MKGKLLLHEVFLGIDLSFNANSNTGHAIMRNTAYRYVQPDHQKCFFTYIKVIGMLIYWL